MDVGFYKDDATKVYMDFVICETVGVGYGDADTFSSNFDIAINFDFIHYILMRGLENMGKEEG